MKSYDSKLKQEQDALLCAGCDDDRHNLENFSSRVTFVIRVTRTCPIFEMRSVNLVKFYVVEQEWESLVKF